jgi:hypothetical protein
LSLLPATLDVIEREVHMDTLSFIVEITKATAWPLAAGAGMGLFRGEIRALLKRIRRGKVGPAEFEFEATVRALASDARALGAPEHAPVVLPDLAQAGTDPRSAVTRAWLEVEDAVLQLACAHAPDARSLPRSVQAALRLLAHAGVVAPEVVALAQDLRQLRNQAVHEADFQPSAESVLSYVRLAGEVAALMRQAGGPG